MYCFLMRISAKFIVNYLDIIFFKYRRFHIFPGYRWDGIDRGNKYEHKILTKSNDRTALKEDEYRWSVSDM